ncbi:hypothetical protein [Streptosporangium canum]|uniref:hypothetical protein n=1 Tax=Streptosporangium canum TaxID=324952 RepID=UPI0033A551D7
MTVEHLPAIQNAELSTRIEYAQQLAFSNMLPKQYHKQPANILFAIEYGEALGIKPILAMNQVHVIEGRPSASAGLISALVRDAGHRLRIWVERDPQGDPVAIATIHRKDDTDFEFRAVWTMERARTAGLAAKAVWKNYPEAMLKARATTEVAREACEEALCGMGYTPEELGAELNDDGSVVVTTVPMRVNQPGQTIRDAVARPARTEDLPAPATATERMISDPQQKKMAALMRERGITDRDTALAFVADVIGREVTSRNELTLAEAGRVIDTLESAPPPTEQPPTADDEVFDGDIVDDTPDQYSEAS